VWLEANFCRNLDSRVYKKNQGWEQGGNKRVDLKLTQDMMNKNPQTSLYNLKLLKYTHSLFEMSLSRQQQSCASALVIKLRAWLTFLSAQTGRI
jgi:hypothetical protein